MRLILLVAALVLGYSAYRWFLKQPPALRWRAAGIIAIAAIVLLVVTGRLPWLFAVVAAAFPVLRRLFGFAFTVLPFVQRLWRQQQAGGAGPAGGRRSVVETRYLRMTLDHDTGTMDGTVLCGALAGQRLGTLSAQQLRDLLAECQHDDEESAALLTAYLQRVHGGEWQGNDNVPAAGGTMSRQEALDVLGLEEGADADRIRDAHRRLMQKLHPDRGGSNYLAVKINQAKDRLLREA